MSARSTYRTPLQAEAECGHLDVVERLLAAKADVNAAAANLGGRTALQAAAEGGHLEVVDRLLVSNADVNAADWHGRTALQAAAEGGHIEVVQRLLVAKADVNAAPAKWYGRTALQAAAEGGHFEVVHRLLAGNADVNAVDFGRSTAVLAAAGRGHLDVVERLLAAKADVNAADSSGRTALQRAAEGGHIEAVERPLAANADVIAADSSGHTALQAAEGGGHLDIVKRIRTAKTNVDAAAAHQSGHRVPHVVPDIGRLDFNPLRTYASATIEEALSRKSFWLLEFLLRSRFEEVAQGLFSWLYELELLGCTRTEMAELLFEEFTDSPWIFFEPKSSTRPEMKLDFHLPNCVHTVLQDGERPLACSTLQTFPFKTMDSFDSNMAQDTEAILQQVSESCGLAGIIPSSRDFSKWIGEVAFENKKTACRVMYGSSDKTCINLNLIRCCVEALQGLSHAIGYFQEISCCCDSFTILSSLESESTKMVQMVQIRFELVDHLHISLREILQQPTDNLRSRDLFQKCTSISSEVFDTLGIPYFTETEGLGPEDSNLEDGGEIVHVIALQYKVSACASWPIAKHIVAPYNRRS